jgi:hypothetical protein
MFLEGLLTYFNKINNEKIARFMGAGHNHHRVKEVKGRYLRGLRVRAANKQVTPE